MGRETKEIQDKIIALKAAKNAVILAHYYQVPEIQEVADFVGDSLELSRKAANSQADIIVFAGVHFMAETAKILNPTRKVILPDLSAGCSLADSCPPEAFAAFCKAHPEHTVVTYINCSAEIKALSDIVCTSSNAELIINSLPTDEKIIFAPDKNLGAYLAAKTGRSLLLWDGACIVHEAFSFEKLLALKQAHPNAQMIAHPESERHVLELADFIGSTSGMIKYVQEQPYDEFIVATEAGILHEMLLRVPNKTLIPAPAVEDNTCACSECGYMKVNTITKVYNCLLNETPVIDIDETLRLAALKPIQRMLALSA
jgi:quinolinate synthase